MQMCTARPSPPREDPALKEQQAQQLEIANLEKKSAKAKTLEKKVASLTGGSGRRSLLKSGSGGMGFYNEFI
jgi:hypothetical protein